MGKKIIKVPSFVYGSSKGNLLEMKIEIEIPSEIPSEELVELANSYLTNGIPYDSQGALINALHEAIIKESKNIKSMSSEKMD